jgi:hypothetical protein
MIEALLLKAPWLSVVGKVVKATFAFLFKWVELPMIVLVVLAGLTTWLAFESNALSKTVADQAAKIEEAHAALETCRTNSAANVEGSSSALETRPRSRR